MATRSVPAGISSELDESVVKPYYAVDLDFVDSNNNAAPVYLWTGVGDLSVGGNTYLGLGGLLEISRTQETSDLSVQGTRITASGLDPIILAKAITNKYHGRDCTLYFGVLDDNNNPTQVELFSGFMDVMTIQEDAESATIELTVENKLIKLEVPSNIRYTSAYQKSKHPGDLGLDYVEALQNRRILWGKT